MGTAVRYEACVIEVPKSVASNSYDGMIAPALRDLSVSCHRTRALETYEKGPIIAWKAIWRSRACLRHQGQL